MHAIKKTLLATLLAATSVSSLAATTADVKVIGTITPVACTPSIAGGGEIDYGNILPDSLAADKINPLDVKELSIHILCDAKAKVGLKAVSQRKGTVASATINYPNGTGAIDNFQLLGANTFHGLGQSDGKNIGGFALAIPADSVTLDGAKADGIELIGTAWGQNNSGNMMNSVDDYVISWAAVGTTVPVDFKEMNGSLKVQAFIDQKSNLDVTKPIALDGLSTIELVYL